MKLSALTIVIIFSSPFFFSCNNTADESVNEKTEISTEKNPSHEEHGSIELNNGEKWKANESMLVNIHNLEQALNNFEGKDYTVLAKTIDENIIEVTSSCTMEGQAHEELHKWLVPFMKLSEQFNEATELIDQERISKELKNALVEFNTFFE